MSINTDILGGMLMNSTRSVDPQLNWHLSAMTISPETVKQLQCKFFFQRDEFANNTRCEATAFHGTFKGDQSAMTRKLWNEVISLLALDSTFQGDLEEELILPQYIRHFERGGNNASALERLTKSQIESCPFGIYKECDIHLKVWWNDTHKSVQEALDSREIISFDRPDEQDGFNRIYTLTFESLKEGLAHFEHMCDYLQQVEGIKARIKLEIASCFYRQPENAVVLPIVRRQS